MPELMDKVKIALRIKTTAFDDAEITPLIEAAKADLLRSGIHYETNPNLVLCDRAVTVYCKMHFGASPEADRLSDVYERLKALLATGGEGNPDAR